MNDVPGPFAGQTGMLNSSTCEHSQQEWEAQQELFIQLYIEEDRTLSEVRSIMASQYSFNATERQYKARIAAWNLDKNVRDGDMKVMLRKELKRKFGGKESEFYLRGRPVPSQKMRRFVQRKGITHDEILQEQMPTPSYITCHTPNAAHSEEEEGMVKDATHQTPYPLDGLELETSTQSPLSCSVQPLELVGRPDSPQMSNSGATNTQDEKSKSSSPEPMFRGTSINFLPSIRSLMLAGKLEEGSAVADEMAYFAARMACFMWLEKWTMVKYAENWMPSSEVKHIAEAAVPSAGFLKWTKTVLSTTQISGNAIQLALLYIYRLKQRHPLLKGKRGSEYRLLTVAFMLSNKFLDDHVYTNRTWAEVCGIRVAEIYLMEVEFISNMQYDMLATKEHWMDWRIKMEKFHQYLGKAARLQPQESTVFASIGTSHQLPIPPVQNSFILQQPDLSDGKSNVTFLVEHPSRSSRKPPRSLEPVPNTAHRLEYISAGSPIIQRVCDTASSPFERCSPRYHLSTSPEYYRRDITSTNPLSFLSPFPICSSSVHSTPVLMSSLDTTAQPLKPHEMHYRNIESSKANIRSGILQNKLPSISELGLDWPPLTDTDVIAY